jgi:hypothetical protein
VQSDEHKMANLWNSFKSLKKQFNELRNEAEKDMQNVKSDITRSKRQMHAACLNLNANLRSTEPRQSLDRVSNEKSQIEEQLREKVLSIFLYSRIPVKHFSSKLFIFSSKFIFSSNCIFLSDKAAGALIYVLLKGLNT